MIKLFVPTRAQVDLVTEDDGIVNRFLSANSGDSSIEYCDSPDVADLIVIFEQWSFKLTDYGRMLLSHAFFVAYAEKILVVNYDDTVGVGFLPGCYVSLRRSKYDATRYRSVSYPKIYNEVLTSKVESNTEPDYLYWFRGSPLSHPVRARIFEALEESPLGLLVENTSTFHSHSEGDKKSYLDELYNCHFALCPRGWSPNSYRLYEAMQMGRCPVIISDEWVESIGPDWSSCSIRIPESEIAKIDEILSARKIDAARLGRNARQEWEAHFSETTRNRTYLKGLLSLHRENPPATMSAKEYGQYWHSKEFLYANNWWYTQKVSRLVKRVLGFQS